MKDRISNKQRLLHILDAITEVENYTTNTDLPAFINKSMMRFATIKQIEITGEAANFITEETKNKFTNLNWRQIIAMRHILIHEYFGVDNDVVWQVITEDIPQLKIEIQQMIAYFNE